MPTEKTIRFRAEDAGVSSVIDRIRRSAEELKDSILESALETSKSTGSVIASIEEEIKTLERRSKVAMAIDAQVTRERFAQKRTEERERFETFEKGPFGKASGVAGREFAREKSRERLKGLEREERGELKQAAAEEDIQIKLLRELIETVKETSREEVREDRKSAERTVSAFIRGDLDEGPVEEKAKARIQQQLLQEEKIGGRKGEGRIRDTAVGVFLGTALSKMSDMLGAAAGAQTGEHMIAELMGGIPLIGGFSGALKGRQREEQEQVEKAINRITGITGTRQRFAFTQFGFATPESLGVGGELARARGFAGPNLRRDVGDILGLERGFSLEQGQLLDITRIAGLGGGGGGSILDVMNVILREYGTPQQIKDRSVDLSGLDGSIDAMTAILRDQSGILESINITAASQTVAAFRNIGGSFADPRAIDRIMTVNRALTAPQNQFSQAENFAVLAQLNPQASFFEIMEMEEKGVSQKGFLGNTLRGIEQRFGTGDLALTKVMKRFGLGAAQSRKLFEGFLEDRSVFDKIGSPEELIDKLDRRDLTKLGAQTTSKLEKEQARVSDAFAKGIRDGLGELGNQLGSDMAKAFREGVQATLETAAKGGGGAANPGFAILAALFATSENEANE